MQHFPRKTVFLLVCGLSVVLAACERPSASFDAGIACETPGYVVTDTFEGARRGECEVYKNGRVRLTITPEDDGKINNSPWFAFQIEPRVAGTAVIRLRYRNGDHRYPPKLSLDGAQWQQVDPEKIRKRWKGVEFEIELGAEPVLVAAQELLLPRDMEAWIAQVDSHGDVQRAELGKSRDGRAIYRLDINDDASEVIFFAGRQHPPEVTGAFAFQAFYEAILADTELAIAFRERFHTIAIPMLNPDGVVEGHWRHNMDGVDLNRDWGPFTQPETKLFNILIY